MGARARPYSQIVKGKPFNPDARMRKILTETLQGSRLLFARRGVRDTKRGVCIVSSMSTYMGTCEEGITVRENANQIY